MANKACAYNSNLNYVVVRDSRDKQLYLLAEKRLSEFIMRVGKGKPDSFEVTQAVSGQAL
jgi:isoleucyl-tRNA synthetase